eukprot:3480500-Pleurochrysis_carterae.AAC.1
MVQLGTRAPRECMTRKILAGSTQRVGSSGQRMTTIGRSSSSQSCSHRSLPAATGAASSGLRIVNQFCAITTYGREPFPFRCRTLQNSAIRFCHLLALPAVALSSTL